MTSHQKKRNVIDSDEDDDDDVAPKKKRKVSKDSDDEDDDDLDDEDVSIRQMLHQPKILYRATRRAAYQSNLSIQYLYRYKMIDIRYII